MQILKLQAIILSELTDIGNFLSIGCVLELYRAHILQRKNATFSSHSWYYQILHFWLADIKEDKTCQNTVQLCLQSMENYSSFFKLG